MLEIHAGNDIQIIHGRHGDMDTIRPVFLRNNPLGDINVRQRSHLIVDLQNNNFIWLITSLQE